MHGRGTHRASILSPVLALVSLLALACGGGAAPTATPTTPTQVLATPTTAPTATPPPPQYQPPHAKPGPSSDTLRFRAFHTAIAPSAVTGGDMDLYIFSLKTEAARALKDNPKVTLYEAPASTVSLVLNPAPAPPGQLNPFSLKKVRFALQYAVNREFIAQETYKGLAKPMIAHVGPFDFDYLTVFDVVKGFNITYDPELAKELVAEAMTEAGAVLKDGTWHFNARPVTLKFIIRVEDERRDIGDLVRTELTKLGFHVSPLYHQFAPAILTVYSTDPALFQWHLYTEGWGRGAAERYDASTINQMASPWLGNMPGWQEVGFWQYENPALDELGKRLFRGDFSGLEERNQLYREATRLSLEESVRVWLATVTNSFPANVNLQGVTQDLVAGPKSIWTLREAYIAGQEVVTVGSLWVWTERTTWNPLGGFGDIYSVDIWRNVHDPPLWRHPFIGDPVPFRVEYEVETAGPEGKLAVPADAVLWDAKADAFRPVGSGARATSKVTFDYTRYFQSTWHHGQPIAMADVFYSIFQSFELAYDEERSRIEVAMAATSRPYLDTFRGFRLLDDQRLEVYVDFWHFVPDYIAEYASPSGLTMPWEVLAAMDRLVFQERRAAYSDTAASRFGVPWLNLVMDRDARAVRNVLRDLAETAFVPQAPFQVGGRSLVTQEEALERYTAAQEWFKQYGMMVISNGPYKLVRFDPPAQFAELEAVRDPSYPFKPGDWFKGSARSVAVAQVQADPLVAGREGSIRVTLEGPGDLALRYVLFDPAAGKTVRTGQADAEGGGSFHITLTPQDTASLTPGLHHLFLLGSSDQLALPTERRVDLQVTPP